MSKRNALIEGHPRDWSSHWQKGKALFRIDRMFDILEGDRESTFFNQTNIYKVWMYKKYKVAKDYITV